MIITPRSVLTPEAKAEYERVRDEAFAVYTAASEPYFNGGKCSRHEYDTVVAPALAEYERANDAAYLQAARKFGLVGAR